MSLNEIIAKQLKAYPKFKKQARISYYDDIILNQVHMDTMFWQSPGELNSPKIPILCIVDVATRFTCYFVQVKKSDNIKGFIKQFITAAKVKFGKKAKYSQNMILITDGAPELKVDAEIAGINVKSQLSTGINKAVIAEVGIRQARAILRDYELSLNIENITDEKANPTRINRKNINKVMKMVEDKINLRAKLRAPKPEPAKWLPPKFNVGDSVFALNFFKYYPHQMKSVMTKQSYMLNWYYEPFKVVKNILIKGVYKYSLAPYTDLHNQLKYYFYDDQLQHINENHKEEYIMHYIQNQKNMKK